MRALLALALLCSAAQHAAAAPASLPAACQELISRTLPGWQAAIAPEDAAAWARSKGWNPVVASGDFDGNGRTDWATIGTSDGKQKLVLCISTKGGKSLAVADDDGCSDVVFTFRRRTKLPNYETGSDEVLAQDAPATSCFEKSGRTFVYRKGRFRVFFHSD